jgi:hypothetical protein
MDSDGRSPSIDAPNAREASTRSAPSGVRATRKPRSASASSTAASTIVS